MPFVKDFFFLMLKNFFQFFLMNYVEHAIGKDKLIASYLIGLGYKSLIINMTFGFFSFMRAQTTK